MDYEKALGKAFKRQKDGTFLYTGNAKGKNAITRVRKMVDKRLRAARVPDVDFEVEHPYASGLVRDMDKIVLRFDESEGQKNIARSK